jgi:hypothetical protein
MALDSVPGPALSGLPEAAVYFPQQPPRLKKRMKTTAATARMVNQFIDSHPLRNMGLLFHFKAFSPECKISGLLKPISSSGIFKSGE